MKPTRYLLLAGLLCLAGCALIVGPTAPHGHATLRLTPQVQGGGYHTAALLSPYTSSNIDHLVVKVFKLAPNGSEEAVMADGSPITLAVPHDNLADQVVLTSLDYDTNYRVRAYAYSDAATASLISVDAASYADVTVGHDDRPTLGSLPVRLADRAFSALGTSSIGVVAGGFSYVGSASMAFRVTSVVTFAGTPGATGSADGTGSAASFDGTTAMKLDGLGHLFAVDFGNNTLRKIDLSSGAVTTLAGTAGATGSVDGTGSAARFNQPIGLAVAGGDLFVADHGNDTIRKVTAEGQVTTLAGSPGVEGSADGTGAAASFHGPLSAIADGSGNLFVSDVYNSTIRKIVIATGVVTTLAGTAGSPGSSDGIGTSASFCYPTALATDGLGNLFVTDTLNHTIRKIVIATGEVTTVAGTAGSSGSSDGTGPSARFDQPVGIAADGLGNLYVAEMNNATVRKIVISSRVVTTILGTAGATGSVDAAGASARLNQPTGLVLDGQGHLYVSDSGNSTIRKITL